MCERPERRKKILEPAESKDLGIVNASVGSVLSSNWNSERGFSLSLSLSLSLSEIKMDTLSLLLTWSVWLKV